MLVAAPTSSLFNWILHRVCGCANGSAISNRADVTEAVKRMAGNAAALAVGGAVAQLAFISVEVAIARALGADSYGVFSTVQAIAVASLILLDFGMMWWMIESGSRKPETLGELLGTTVVLKLAGFVVLYPLVAWLLLLAGYDERTVGFFLVFFVYCLTIAVQDSFAAVYTARQQMSVNALFQGGAPVFIAILAGAVLFLGGGLNGVGAAYVAGGLVVTIVWGAMTWRQERPRVRLQTSGQVLYKSYLYGLTSLLVHVFRKGDILLLSMLAPISQVGIYAAGAKLLELAFKVPLLGTFVVSPTLFQQDQSDGALYRRSADLFVRVSAAAGLFLAVVCFHSADWLIQLIFGSGYEAAALVLRVLSGSFALKFTASSLQTVLTTRGQHAERTRALGVSTAAALAGHVMIIPRLGITGAALVVLAAELLLCALYLRAIGDRRLRAILVKRIAGAAIVLVVAVGVPLAAGLTGPAASGIGFALAAAAMLGVGFVQAGEIAAVRQGIRRRRPGKDSDPTSFGP